MQTTVVFKSGTQLSFDATPEVTQHDDELEVTFADGCDQVHLLDLNEVAALITRNDMPPELGTF